MQSFAQTNGQHQKVGSSLQAFQAAAPLSQDATRNHVWSSENAYITLNSGIQPSERSNITSHNGANLNRHLANVQNSAASNQVVNSQNGAKAKQSYSKLLQYLQSKEDSQSGNSPNLGPLLQTIRNAAQLQSLHRNSANQTPQNPTYIQQNVAQLQSFHQTSANQTPQNTVYPQQSAAQPQTFHQNSTNQTPQNTVYPQLNVAQLQTFNQNSANQTPQNTAYPQLNVAQLQTFNQNSTNQTPQNTAYPQLNVAQLQTFHQNSTNQTPQNTMYPQQNVAQLQSFNQNSANQTPQNTAYPQQNVAQLQSFHQNSANQTPQNTTYPQLNLSSCWKPLAASNAMQTANVHTGHPQTNASLHYVYQISDGGILSTAAAASHLHEQVFKSNMLVPAAIHNGQAVQAAQNQIPGPSATQQRLSSSYLSRHGMVTSQSYGVNSMTAQPSSTRTLYASNGGEKSQPHNAQTEFLYKNWTNTSSSNTHSMNQSVVRYVGVANEISRHANVAQLQNPRPQVTTDGQCMSSSAGSDSYPPPYSLHVGMARQSNWNGQTVTSVSSTNSFNMNVSPSLPLHSGQSMPQSIVSRAQHTVNTQPLQRPLQDASSVTTAEREETRGEMDWALLQNKDMPSKGNPVLSTCNAPNMAYLARHPELLNILGYTTQIAQSDVSAHSTSSHVGAKVVAVVQPLSQENAGTSLNTTSPDPDSDLEKDCISPDVAKHRAVENAAEQARLQEEILIEISSDEEMSNDDTILSSSDSEPHSPSRTSEPDSEAAAQHTSELKANESCPKEQNERTTPPSESVPDLSSLPATPWTSKALTELVLMIEKENVSKHHNLLALYKAWREIFHPSMLQDYILKVVKLCDSFFNEDTIVLSQVEQSKLKHYHVFKDHEVYSEPPYKSSWLNLNDQLDDIDKEFGYPWILRCHQYVHDTDSEMEQVNLADGIPEPIVNEVANAVLTESESTDLIEDQQAPPVETPLTPLASSNESESKDLNTAYLFKINVLAPEEAKVFYEQIQKNVDQIIDLQELTGNVVKNMTPKEKDVAPKESVDPISIKGEQIDQICCLAKLIEMQSGLSRPSYKCQCHKDEKDSGNSAKTLILDPDDPEKSQDNGCQIISLSSADLCNELCKIIDLTNDHDEPLPFPYQKPMSVSGESIGSQSDDDAGDIDTELSDEDPIPSGEMANVVIEMTESVDEFRSTETPKSSAAVTGPGQTGQSPEIEVPLLISDEEEDSMEAQLQSTDVAELSLESQEDGEATNQTTFSHHVERESLVTVRKRQSRLDQYFPSLTESKICKEPADVNLQNASEGKTVELFLFGSGKPEKGASLGSTSHLCWPSMLSNKHPPPPTVVSVNLKPLRRNSADSSSTPNRSVKELLYEKWRKSFPPMSLSKVKGHKKKWKIQRSLSAPLPTASLKRRNLSSPSETEATGENGKCRRKLKRRSISTSLSPKEAKKRRYSVRLRQERSSADNEDESQDATLLQENIVLKFSVLPNTFSFTDGSTERNETTDPMSDKPELKEDRTANNAVNPKVRQWYPSPQKQYQPLRGLRNVSLFTEYQKKYNKKHSSSEKLP